MADLTGMAVVARAYAAAWRAHGRHARARLARSRHVLVSAALVLAGLGCALLGGWLVGRWCLGLVLIAESAGAVVIGLNRDDGEPPPSRGARTLAEILEDAGRAP